MEARDLVGVILAGGASSRMGRPKETLVFEGEPLLQRQQRLLFEVGVRRVLLALGGADRVDQPGPGTQARRADQAARADGADPSPHPCLLPEMTGEIIHDAPGSGGPLAGIVAGLQRIRRSPPDAFSAGGILVLAVDMPRLEAGLLTELVEGAGLGLGAAPRVEGRWEPLAAVYPQEALEPATRLLAGGRSASPSALLDELLASGRLQAHEVLPDQVAGLRSWNTPEDLTGS